MKKILLTISQKFNFFDIANWTLFIVVLVLYVGWGLRLPLSQAPDEALRDCIPLWIYKHGKLPLGFEADLGWNGGNFNYSYRPYLLSIFSAILLKVFSSFLQDESLVFFIIRLPNILVGSLSVIFAYKVGQLFFKRKSASLFYAILISFLPQFVFLSSYHNNDNFTVFCALIILYAWGLGMRNNWDLKSLIVLSFGIGILALSYYNAYGWIICSIFFVFYSVKKQSNSDGKWVFRFTKIFFLVFMFSCFICAWWFIRSFINNRGDILKLSMYVPKKEGSSIFSLVKNINWWTTSIFSYICGLGYMNIWAKKGIYYVYMMYICIGALFSLIKFFKSDEDYRMIYFLLVLLIFITIFLSLCFSVSVYQPQGRYLIPSLPALMFIVVEGYYYLYTIFKIKVSFNRISAYLSAFWVILFFIIFFSVIKPYVWGKVILSFCFGRNPKTEQLQSVNLLLQNVKKYESFNVAVWSRNDGQDDLKWYGFSNDNYCDILSSSRSINEIMLKYGHTDIFPYVDYNVLEIPQNNFMEDGIYDIHVYGIRHNKQERIAMTELLVSQYSSIISLSEDSSYIQFDFKNMHEYDELQIAVWSEDGGQDDLHWFYTSVKEKEAGSYDIPLDSYSTNGLYLIDVYGKKGENNYFLNRHTLNINFHDNVED